MNHKHAYDAATGDLRGVCAGPSPSQVSAWEAQGLTVIDGPALDRNLYNYLGGDLTAKIEVSLTPDVSSIDADGVDQAVVAVSVAGEEPPASIELLVAGTAETVNLTNGQGTLDPISAETPCTVQVALADTITYRGEPVEIEAVEHG
jgi:DNA/RNA endonuclease YhcR with UshA esterase domain